jgi:hypothetical protein
MTGVTIFFGGWGGQDSPWTFRNAYLRSTTLRVECRVFLMAYKYVYALFLTLKPLLCT